MTNWGDGGRGDFPPINNFNFQAYDLLSRIQDPTNRLRAEGGYWNLVNQTLGQLNALQSQSFAHIGAFCRVVDDFALRQSPHTSGSLNSAGLELGYFNLSTINNRYIVGFAVGTMLDVSTGSVVPSRENAHVMLSIYSADGNYHLPSIDPELYTMAMVGLDRLLDVYFHDPNQFVLDHSGQIISVYPTPNNFPASVAHFEY